MKSFTRSRGEVILEILMFLKAPFVMGLDLSARNWAMRMKAVYATQIIFVCRNDTAIAPAWL